MHYRTSVNKQITSFFTISSHLFLFCLLKLSLNLLGTFLGDVNYLTVCKLQSYSAWQGHRVRPAGGSLFIYSCNNILSSWCCCRKTEREHKAIFNWFRWPRALTCRSFIANWHEVAVDGTKCEAWRRTSDRCRYNTTVSVAIFFYFHSLEFWA